MTAHAYAPLVIVLLACGGNRSALNELVEPAGPVCSPVAAAGVNWVTVQLTYPAVTLRLPPGWTKRAERYEGFPVSSDSAHTFSQDGNPFQSITIALSGNVAAFAASGPSAGSTEYSECRWRVGEYVATRRTWIDVLSRASNGVDGTSLFWSRVTLQLGREQYLLAAGSSMDRAGQEETLRALGTLRPRDSREP